MAGALITWQTHPVAKYQNVRNAKNSPATCLPTNCLTRSNILPQLQFSLAQLLGQRRDLPLNDPL